MSRRAPNACPMLVALAALALASPAGAEGGFFDPIAAVAVLVDAEAFLDQEVEVNDQDRFAFAFSTAVAALGGGVASLAFEGDPDPRIDYVLMLSNLSASEVSVDLQIIMPMVAVGAGVPVSASLDVALVDPGGDGASIATFLPDVQSAFASEDGAVFTRLGVDVGGQLVEDPGASFTTGPIPGPAPDPAAGPAFTQLLMLASFRLSPGDTATLEGSVLVPEPGPMLLLAAGLGGLVVRRRRARHMAGTE